MSHTECMYLCSPDIRVISDCTKYIVRIDFSTVEGDVVRAGTPISREGKVANSADAFGILLRDTWRVSPFAKICIDGFIDFPLAQEHSGVVLTPEAKAAMGNINFVGDPEAAAGGGSWNNLKDRPFYENIEIEGDFELFVSEGKRVQTSSRLDEITWEGTTDVLSDIGRLIEEYYNRGRDVIVYYDGVRYSCAPWKSGFGNRNTSDIGDGVGLPFKFQVFTYATPPYSTKFWLNCSHGKSPTIRIVFENVETKLIDSKFLGEDIARTDELFGGSWDDLSERPFYENVEITTLYDNPTFKGGSSAGSGVYADPIANSSSARKEMIDKLADTEQVTVYYDGIRYDCEVTIKASSVSDIYKAATFGNETVRSSQYDSTRGPFYVMMDEGGGYANIYVRDNATHDVKIVLEKTELKQLDGKFLPKAEAVTNVTAAPTAEQFNSLLASLRAAGYLAE